MAIKYSEIKEKIGDSKLTEKELAAIDNLEKYIDEIIDKDFDNQPLTFDLRIINFEAPAVKGGDVNFKDTRKKLMTKELERRYKAVGWDISYSFEEYSNDWILKGKGK